jgi:hypothetical protein
MHCMFSFTVYATFFIVFDSVVLVLVVFMFLLLLVVAVLVDHIVDDHLNFASTILVTLCQS